VLAATLLIGVGLVVYYFTQTTVTLDVSGQIWEHRTHADTVQDVLDEANILIDPEDEIWPDPAATLEDGMTITVRKAFAMAVAVDGDVRQVRTQSMHPLDVLAEQAIPVGEYDMIEVDGRAYTPDTLSEQHWDSPPRIIRVEHSATLSVIDADQTLLIHTTQTDVGRALDAAGLKLYLADRVIPDLSTPVTDGLAINIYRSVPFTLVMDGQQLTTRAYGPTVGDALAAVNVALIGQDYTIPAEDAPLEPDMTIRVVRVIEEIAIEQELIPFPIEYRPDPDLPPGEERTLQPGEDGQRERLIRVRYEDGEEVSRVIQEERISQTPIPRLIVRGPQADGEDYTP
jgi:uncharacterized protein YabE (DUF348 family)